MSAGATSSRQLSGREYSRESMNTASPFCHRTLTGHTGSRAALLLSGQRLLKNT